MSSLESFGVGPVEQLDRDPTLKRAVEIVQQTFPGAIDLNASTEPPQPPRRMAATTTESTAPASEPPSVSPPDLSRDHLFTTLKDLITEVFSHGANRGGAKQWLSLRLRTLNVRRLNDLTLEQLYEMCCELEQTLELRRGN